MSYRASCFVSCALLAIAARPARAETLWISAAQARKLSPTMHLGSSLGLQEENLLGDFLAPTVMSDPSKPDAESYAEFNAPVRQGGAYYVWARVRYPMGNGDSFGFSLVHKGTPGPIQALGDGRHDQRNWHWDSQAAGPNAAAGSGRLTVELDAGQVALRITARGARATVFYPGYRGGATGRWRWTEAAFNPHLNFLCITSDPQYIPSDADACRAAGVRPTPSLPEPHVPPLRLKTLSAADWQASDRQPLPDFMRCPRWYTKDSWRQELETRAPGDIAKLVRQVAACHGNVLRISVMFGGEAFYQSRVAPHAPGLGNLDYLREAVDAGRRYGVKIVVYLWPWGLCVDHPAYREIVIRDPGGEIPSRADYTSNDFGGKYGFACPNTPAFRKFYRDVLTEIFTQYKPDGIYIDGLTPNFCFCRHCQSMYRRMFGVEMPVEKIAKFYWPVTYWGVLTSAPFLIGDPHDPDARRFTAMLGRSQKEITQLFTETVNGCKPDAATMYHSYPKANNVRYYDGTLTEIYATRPWVHSAWNFGEVANYSNVFPVPVMSNVYPHDHCIAAESRCKALQALANGTYPNYWSTLEMAPVFGFIERNAEYFDFARTAPNKFVTLARDFHLDTASEATPAPEGVRYARDRFLAPAIGAYSAIIRSGLALSTIHRLSLERQLRGTRVLVLPNAGLLSDEQLKAIRELVRQGGGLIATHETSLYDENGTRRGDFGLADLFGAHYVGVRPAAKRTLRVTAPRHPVAAALGEGALEHDEPHVTVRPDTAEVLAYLQGAEADEAQSPAILVHSFGKGRVVYIPGRPDSIQCALLTAWIERLFAAAIRWAAAEEPPVVVRADAMVGATLFDQPQRRILHLLNHNRDSTYYGAELTPLENVRVDMAIPAGRRVERIHRLWTPADLAFTQGKGRVKFLLPRLDEYEVIAVGWRSNVEAAETGAPGTSDRVKDPEAAQDWRPRNTEEAIQRLQRISASTMFGNCCFWAWELELAILKKDRDLAQRIAAILGRLQRADGRWGLGNAWGRGKVDFKDRMPEDAESWDVAEAACALLDYGEAFGDPEFLPHVRKAAAYLKTCVRYAGGKPYLPHMAECNNLLQPHSTINTALLFSRLPEYKDLARRLHQSGVAMNFFRLTPHEDLKTLDPPLVGQEVNDFEKVQIGYYLHLMGDPAGSRLMARYWKLSDLNHPRGGAYLVLAYAKLGQWDKARHFAAVMKDYKPVKGYEYALRDMIDYVRVANHGAGTKK